MVSRQDVFDHRCRRANLILRFGLQCDLIQFHHLGLKLTASPSHDRIADSLSKRSHRDVDVRREILGVKRAADRRGRVSGFQDADDLVFVGALGNVDTFPKWLLKGEQFFGDAGGNNTNRVRLHFVGVGEESTAAFANF